MSAPPGKVLIVDDEPYMLRVAELSLRKGGFELFTARDGRQAIELARRIRPDVMVMDVLMPELDGLSALRQLKQDPDTAGIPVIMVTARGHIMTRQEAEECGAALFLTKPFSPTQLLNETRRLIATRGAPGPRTPEAGPAA